MEQTVVYGLFVDGKLSGYCASFEIASALAREHVATNPPMRIECAVPPSQLRVWSYNYVGDTWVETQVSASATGPA